MSPSCRRFKINFQRLHLQGRAHVNHVFSPSPVISRKSLQNCSRSGSSRDYVSHPSCYLRIALLILLFSSEVEVSVDRRPGENSGFRYSYGTKEKPILCQTQHCYLSSLSEQGKGIKLLMMASHGSSSSSGPSVEDRIDSLENTMGRLRARLDNQDKLLQATSKAGEQTWDLLNKDIRKLQADHSSSTENLEDFKEETRTSFKDAANIQGDFGKRISALETAVSKLMAKLGK